MKLRKIGFGIVVAFAAASIYAILIWFGVHSDTLNNHERKIELTQSRLSHTEEINKDVQKELLSYVRELEDKLALSEVETQIAIKNINKILQDAVEQSEERSNVSVKNKITTVYQAIGNITDIVSKNSANITLTKTDIELLFSLREADKNIWEANSVVVAEESVLPALEIISDPLSPNVNESPQSTLYREPLMSVCPKTPDDSSKAMRILKRVMGKTASTGSYPFTANFNIGSDGLATEIKVNGSGPIKLRKAVEKYVATLEWVVSEAVEGCELKIKLDID